MSKKIYSLPYRVALDTKTFESQYKLLNRCLVTNAFLRKIGFIPSPAFSLCGESDESLEHLFFPCHYTKNFYAEDIKWLDDHKVKNENLSDKYIMFGIIRCENEIFVNHILLMENNTYTPVDRTNLHLPLEFLIPKLTLFS